MTNIKDTQINTASISVNNIEAISFYANGFDAKQKCHYEIYQISQQNHNTKLVAIASSQATSNSSLLKSLANAGAIIPKSIPARNQLFDKIDNQRASTTKEISVTDQLGWLDSEHKKFVVRGDKIYGATIGEDVVLVEKQSLPQHFAVSGTLKEWQKSIASLCCDNANLIFAISTAFAPALLSIMNIPSGGFQFVGRSSIGKTTCLKVAASVFGKNMINWNSTNNAITRKAVSYNDSLLVIDETGQAGDPKSVIDSIYQLAGGQGKGRLIEDESQSIWRILFLSSSEKTIEEIAIDAKKKLQLGQSVRLIDIDVNSSKYGAFNNIHNFVNSKELVDAINSVCEQFYGSAGDVYLTKLVAWASRDIDDLKKWLNERIQYYYTKSKISLGNGLDSRIAERFALVYAAGKLARHFKILPKEMKVFRAVKSCHKRIMLLQNYNEIAKPIMNQHSPAECILLVKKFIVENKSSFIKVRYDSKKLKNEEEFSDVGIKYKNSKNKTEYLFMLDYFKSTVCKGLSHDDVIKSLNSNALLLGKDGKTAQRRLIRAGGVTRVVAISSAILKFEPTNKK